MPRFDRAHPQSLTQGVNLRGVPTLRQLGSLRRVALHPAVWCLPVMALLVHLAMPFNNEYYEFFVNFDPQGDYQQQEWQHTERVFRYTSGVLCGHLLALLVGAALSRRHRQLVALAVAVPLGGLLALVAVAVAFSKARSLEADWVVGPAVDDPILMPVLLRELAAFPLFAAAGVGLGILLPRLRRYGVKVLLLAGWVVATLTGLLDEADTWPWLIWTVPVVAAGAAIVRAGLSVDLLTEPPELVGDGGRGASIALLVGVTAYAIGLNLAAHLAQRRRLARK